LTFELRRERLFDAPPEVVFDTFVDLDAQQELFADPPGRGWTVLESEINLRVGGTWIMVIGKPDGEQYRLTYVFTEIDRPRRLAATFSMHYGDSGQTEDCTVSLMLDEQNGKTLLTLVQSGFEMEEERDAYLSGAPGFLDALQRAVSSRQVR
jgi:uncharacterized protein YndB with AHSA1/START domain